jgi:hypothetical protein
MDSETPVAVPETPVAAPETPVAAPETPVAAPETPVAAPETPVAAPETPVAAPETPVAAPETYSLMPIIDLIVEPQFEGLVIPPVSLFFRLFRRYAEEILIPWPSDIRRCYLLFGYIYTLDGRLCVGVYVDDPSLDYGVSLMDLDEFNPDLKYFWFLPECILGRYRHPEPDDWASDDDEQCCQCCIYVP